MSGKRNLFRRQEVYVACEDIDFIWDVIDTQKFVDMWTNGMSVAEIAEAFDRDPDEVIVLAIDMARNELIERRNNGLLGG